MTLRPRLAAAAAVVALGSCLAIAAWSSQAASTPTPSSEPSAEPGGPPTTGTSEPTALLVEATNAPLAVPGSDGRVHLEYDLVVTNVFVVPATITSVDVLAPDGSALLQLAGDALAAVTEPLIGDTPVDPPAVVPPSGAVAVVVDVEVPPGQEPTQLAHRVTYSLPDSPANALIPGRVITGPDLDVDLRPPVVIAPPLRGTGWISLNGCCDPNAHRSLRYALDGERILKAQTFAIDYVQLRDGFFFTGDGASIADYPYFGSDVVAVAEAEVVFVREDMPEETPIQPPRNVKAPIDYAGNQVVLQIAPDVWAVYAHLQTGSVEVEVGDLVTTGQLLGRLGNTGNTTLPHLHFVLTDDPDFAAADSLPYVFDDYTLAGDVTPEALQAALSGPTVLPIPVTGPPRPQSDTHPLLLSVSDVPR